MVRIKRVLVVDDEAPAHAVITAHFAQLDVEIEVKSFYDGASALTYLLANPKSVDLLILDVDMPRLNGMELLKSLPVKIPTIISTAYTDFAFDAYQYDAIDYLLKPISFSRFVKAMSKVNGNVDEVKENETVLDLIIKGERQLLPANNIVYVQSVGNYVRIFQNTGSSLVYHCTLKALHAQLGAKMFVQISKSNIVNKSYIQEFTGNELVLKSGESLAVGRQYKELLK